VETLLVDHAGFYFQLAPLVIWSLASGSFMAWLASAAMPFWSRLFNGQLEEHWTRMHSAKASSPREIAAGTLAAEGHDSEQSRWGIYLGLGLLAAILFLPYWQGQLGIWLGLFVYTLWGVSSQAVGRSAISKRARLRGLWRPMKATWPLLLFMAWLHLFHGEGHLLGLWGMTLEGLQSFVLHAVRLLNLAILGPRLLPYFPKGWLKRSPSPFAQGVILALPALAGLPSAVPGAARHFWKAWREQGWRGFEEGLLRFSGEVMGETATKIKNRI
jgi:hypothetical protein